MAFMDNKFIIRRRSLVVTYTTSMPTPASSAPMSVAPAAVVDEAAPESAAHPTRAAFERIAVMGARSALVLQG